jgi:hypothetical protein
MDDKVDDFITEGVFFTFPGELGDIGVARWIRYVPPKQEFSPNRVVINFKLFKKERNVISFPTEFDPPFTIEVRYNQEDLDAVGGDPNKLRLAYWDGEKWIEFTRDEHGYRLEDRPIDNWMGRAYVEITVLPDPLIAWGQ